MNSVRPNRIVRDAVPDLFDHLYSTHVVLAIGDGQTELWAAATATPRKALAGVLQSLPSGWMVTLTGESLSLEQATELDFRPNEVRKLASHKQAASTGLIAAS
jgi:hypothetical protein